MDDDKKKVESTEVTQADIDEVQKAEQNGEKLLDEGTIQGLVADFMQEQEDDLNAIADEVYDELTKEI